MNKDLLNSIVENVLQGRRNKDDDGIEEGAVGQPGVTELVKEALDSGIEANKILLDGLSRGMERVGEKYESGEYFIPICLLPQKRLKPAWPLWNHTWLTMV